MGKVDFGFDLPFPEQADFLRKKINLPSDRWDSIEKSAHDRGFIVAGATKADLIQDLHNSVDKYVANGGSWENFKTDFKKIVTDHGWHGWTGEGTKAGENWRTKIILETNIRSSYAAGRWQQLQAVKTSLPFWEYHHNDSVLRPRPLHKQWGDSRLCLPADHPFWQTHYPPNGWRCRCRVVARFKASAGAATTPPEGWNTSNPKTGEPPGIDKGWGYAPGANVNQSLEDAVAKKLIKYEPAIRKAMEHHLAQVKPATAAVLEKLSVDQVLSRGNHLRESIEQQIGEITDPIEWQAKFREALGNHMRQNYGAGTVPVDLSVHKKGRGASDISDALPAKSIINAITKRLNEAVELLPAQWIKDLNGYQVENQPRKLRIAVMASRRAYYSGGHVHAIFVNQVTDTSVHLHEFMHAMQRVRPDIDKIVQEFHIRRTTVDGVREKLSPYVTRSGYVVEDEKVRKDHYLSGYYGKEYTRNAKLYEGDEGSREVLTMSTQHVLRGEEHLDPKDNKFLNDLKVQPGGHGQEVINLVLGLLTGL